MAQTLADVPVTNTWVDLAAVHPSIANANVTIQCASSGNIGIVWGGTSAPPANTNGFVLESRDSDQGSAANVWVRAFDGSETVAVRLL